MNQALCARRIVPTTISALLCCAAVCTAFEERGTKTGRIQDHSASATSFYDIARRVRFNTQPASAAQLANWADAIVVGRIVGIADGRTFHGAPSDPNSMKTVVARVAIEDAVRGVDSRFVNVAFWRTDLSSPQEFAAAIPHDRMLMFLSIADEQTETHDARRGVPEGEVLYELSSPQSMIVDGENGPLQVLSDQIDEFASQGESFESLVSNARKAKRELPAAAAMGVATRNRRCREFLGESTIDPSQYAASPTSMTAPLESPCKDLPQ